MLLVLPILQRTSRAGIMLSAALIWSGIWFIIFSATRQMPLALAAMFCAGIGIPVVLTTANSLIQVLVPGHMRARLLSIWIMVSFGFQPFASLAVGYSAQVFGAENAVLINGAFMALGCAYLGKMRRQRRAKRPGCGAWSKSSQMTVPRPSKTDSRWCTGIRSRVPAPSVSPSFRTGPRSSRY